jgi:hypothetical protein
LQRLKTILAVHEKGMVSKNRRYIEVIKHNKKTSSDTSFNYYKLLSKALSVSRESSYFP